VGVLQIVQRYHQPGAYRRASVIRTICGSKCFFQLFPINDIGKLYQPMAAVDDLGQLDTKKLLLSILVCWLFWFHVI